MSQNIVVVGAGIIGASTAYQLAKAGARVTLIDAGGANATQASFGWINASFFLDKDHFHLRADSIKAYRDLARELELPVSWCGCLCFENKGAAFDQQRDALKDLGYAATEIDAATFARLEPHVANPPEQCLMFQQEAAAESGPLAAKLLDAATSLGARVLSGVAITGFETQGSRVTGVRTPHGTMHADQTVLAAGTATEHLMATLDLPLPMLTRPALMLRTAPVPKALSHILVTEIGELRQLPDGSLMMPAAIAHQRDEAETLGDPQQEADAALARLQALLPDLPLTWSHANVAHRPVPQDGKPVAGHAMDGLYTATMHSGITLGALMGQLISTEVMQGPTNETAKRLAPYRPDRFKTGL